MPGDPRAVPARAGDPQPDRSRYPCTAPSGATPDRRCHLPELQGGIASLLESFDLETAADVKPTTLAAVPAIGQARINALLAWRQRIESHADPRTAGLQLTKRLHQLHGHRLRNMQDRLAQIPAEMERLIRKFTGMRPMIKRQIDNLT